MKIAVADLLNGMRIDEDLVNMDGQLITTKNTLVTPDLIEKLKQFGVKDIEAEATPEYWELIKKRDLQFSQKSHKKPKTVLEETIFDVRETEAFSAFKDSCETNNKTISTSFENILSDENNTEEFGVMEAMSDTLYKNNKNNVNLIDMVYLMRNNADSVYSHSLNVGMVAGQLGKWLKLPEDEVQLLVTCGLFHDIGKLMIPKNILDKPAALTDDEYEIMKSHTQKGYEFLSKFDHLDQIIKDVALKHHERCDGSGYPNGLSGDQIDKFSKIIGIADVYTAMTSDRIYRGSICPFAVAAELEKEGLHKFDAHFVMTFLDNMLTSYLQRKVELNNGQVGIVLLLNRYQKSKPLIELTNGETIDLAKHADLYITKLLDY
ncbi:MAG: HD-GYP domain-containing protein [Eubacteriales bacterium]